MSNGRLKGIRQGTSVITRRHVECQSCGRAFVLRIGVSGGEQRFAFECPHCRVVLRGVLNAEPGDEERLPRLDVRSEDFEELPFSDEREADAVAITVYTDLAVPTSLQGIPATDAVISPFILSTQLCGQDETLDLRARIEELRTMRERFFPALRRALSIFGVGDLERLPDALQAVPGADFSQMQIYDPVYQLGRLVGMMYVPLGSIEPRSFAVAEVIDLGIECERAHGDAYQALLDELFETHGLAEHRRRVVDTTAACFSAHDALLAPLFWECVDPAHRQQVDDFQVMRDDFPEVAARYQEIFELTSRTLAYLGLLVNLRHRGDPTQWADGRRRTADQILNHTTARNREFIGDELPIAWHFIQGINRHTRNQIGHRLVGFDFRAQALVDDHGSRVNYLLFLEDYLEAVRITQYLLGVMEKLTVDRRRGRTPQREDTGLPVGR
jgi:hypothetical protein